MRAAADRQSLAIELVLLGYPGGDGAQVAQIDPAPVPVDRGLPAATVSRGSVDVRDDQRDPAIDERGKVRQMSSERRTRLPFRPAVRIEHRGYLAPCVPRPV